MAMSRMAALCLRLLNLMIISVTEIYIHSHHFYITNTQRLLRVNRDLGYV